MRIDSIIRFSVYLLLSFLTPLLLSGCFQEFFGWGKNAPSAETDRISLAAEEGKQDNRELSAEKPATDSKIFEPAEDQSFTGQNRPQPPETSMPPASSTTLPNNGPAPVLSPSGRRESTIRPPDYSYQNARLTEDTAWHGEVLIEGGLTVSPQTTLTVKNGTIVRFRGSTDGAHASLVIQGRLVVNGSADRPVIFRSLFEGAETGDWQGIVLLASGKKNLIENCRVEGAETGLDASFSTITLKNTAFNRCRSGARVQDCIVVMSGGGASECGTGMIFYDSEADIRSAGFFGNRMGVLAARTSLALGEAKFTGNNSQALFAEQCRLNIAGNSFTANGSGLNIIGSEGTVSGNRIAKNTVNGLLLAQSRMQVKANEVERNAKAGIRVEDGKAIAWGNAIFANGEYDLYNAGTEEFRAIGNWWGDDGTNVAGRIYDRRTDESRGRVLYLPVLQKRPILDMP